MDFRFRHDLKPDLLDLNLRGLLVNPHGRICRTVFVILTAFASAATFWLWWGVVAFWELLAKFGGSAVYAVGAPCLFMVAGAGLYVVGCLVAKRLHDVDASARHALWLVAAALPGLAAWAIHGDGWLWLTAKGVAVCIAGGLAVIPGSPDVNRYGAVDYWG